MGSGPTSSSAQPAGFRFRFRKGTEKTLLRSSSPASAPFPSSSFILVQEHVPSMSTAVGSNLISSYLIDCPPPGPTGNPEAFLCRQENISLLINLSTGTCVRAEAGKPISRSLPPPWHLVLLQQSSPSCSPPPCFRTASPACLTVLRLGTPGALRSSGRAPLTLFRADHPPAPRAAPGWGLGDSVSQLVTDAVQ